MPSDRATAALVASALAYSQAFGSPDEQQTHRELLDACSLYRRTSSDGVPLCAFCGVLVPPHRVGGFRKVEGWAELRSKGGTHALVDQRVTGEVACADCIRDRRLGIAHEQSSLL